MPLPGGQDHWSNADTVKLLERMETNLPSNDSHTFKSNPVTDGLGKSGFKDYSGETCKLKWLHISYHMRKFRTLTQLVLEAKEGVERPPQQYPKLRSQELTKLLSEKYRELPEQISLKYVQDFQKEKGEFEDKLAGGPNSAGRKFPRHVRDVKSPPENSFARRVKFHGEPRSPREGAENTSMKGGPGPKIRKKDLQPLSAGSLQGGLGRGSRLQRQNHQRLLGAILMAHGHQGKMKEGRKEGRRSSDPSSGDADDYGESEHSGPSSSSPGHSSDSDSDSS
ncbi:unnamed protein product [Nyctereutes procyonoides]|uniref:(raccoon dog) hypothetical protein n=1 Tax=Nyctereutes procyonoides TaxID=34880 RepID=A0A811YA44_NYCPR|nr:unnamed protein product [Nyctereutes procyonoides]